MDFDAISWDSMHHWPLLRGNDAQGNLPFLLCSGQPGLENLVDKLVGAANRQRLTTGLVSESDQPPS